jgi:hypothetical protein
MRIRDFDLRGLVLHVQFFVQPVKLGAGERRLVAAMTIVNKKKERTFKVRLRMMLSFSGLMGQAPLPYLQDRPQCETSRRRP